MKFTVVEQGKEFDQLALEGSLDMEGVEAIQNQFSRLASVSRVHTIVDVSKVDYISSLAMGMLVSAAKGLHLHHKKLFLLKPQELVRKAILTTRLEQFLPMVNGFDEVRASVQEQNV